MTMLLPVPAEALRRIWPDLRAPLQSLADRHDEEWLPEDVYHEVLVHNAYLFATHDLTAFVVLKVLSASWGRDLHVWIASNGTTIPARDFLEQIRSIARDNDCGQIAFESERKGWIRALPGVRARHSYTIKV